MKKILVAILLILMVFVGCSKREVSSVAPPQSAESSIRTQDSSGKKVLYWYDPMTPGQKFDKPGKSPFMDMQLVPKYATEDSAENSSVAISSMTVQNLGIRLEKSAMMSFGESFSAVGRVEPNEHRIYAVQTRIPGFVERLSVRAVGDSVRKGQKIAEIYAPEILATQQEYLALLPLTQLDADNSLKQAARGRLKLLGMTESEIEAIAISNKPSPRFGVYAPASGVVSELGIREGAQLMPGTSLIQLSDLSDVWVIADVPERDAARLKVGLTAEVKFQSIPSETFKGKVSYLYPTLNDASRTLQARVELPNKDFRLRPGMYANIIFTGQTHEALAIPTESVIETGKRKIVIIKSGEGYRPVEVVTAQERDNYTEVLQGLSEGDEVVSSGQFLIDSEASLSGVLAKLSRQVVSINIINGTVKKLAGKPFEEVFVGHGKVVGINFKRGTVTLEHEAITKLNWPAMTMDFLVKDAQLLTKIKVNDLVDFDLKADTKEEYVIVRIERNADKKGANP
jgi:Cu(I)/Ag(I) efflux system membrane fusion protein